jgi:four helix bundle protein
MSREDIQTFRDLHAWQAAMDLSLFAYELAKRLPPSERFELSAQMRRSAVSVPANVAEGQSSGRDGRYLNHLRIALGSLGELETEIEIARRLGFISEREYGHAEQLLEEQDSCSTVSPEAFSADGSNVGGVV